MSSNPTFDELWNQALESYLRSTHRAPQDLAAQRQLRGIGDLFTQLETDQHEFSDWRNKHRTAFSALSKAVQPLEALLNVPQTAPPASPYAPACAVLGAALFLIKAANGMSEAYEWIEQLFEKLGEFVHRLEEYIGGGMNVHLQHKVVAILSCLLEILGRSEKVIRDGRFKHFTAVLFLGKDERVKASFDRLSSLVDDEERLVLAISYATNQRIDRKTDNIDRNTERAAEISERMEEKVDQVAFSIQDATSEIRTMGQDAHLEKTLFTPAVAKNIALYGEYADDALPNSGEWLLAEEKLQNWIGGRSPLLWVSGSPGTGKSYLSAITVSKLLATYPQDPAHPNRVSVGFFYVKEHDQHLRDLGNMLKSIAYQIASVDSVFKSHVVSVLARPGRAIGPRKIWEDLFLDFFGSTRKITNSAMIVIDGLDEATEKTIKDLFRCLEDLGDLAQLRPRLCFAVFGRPELTEYIKPKLQRCTPLIEIGEKNEVDIRLYIKQHVTEILVVRQTMKLKSKKAAIRLARDIRDKLMARADGMFFKVVLIMNQLYDKERVSSVLEAIEDSPPELDAMIRRVFERLAWNEDVGKEDLNEILTWVAYSKRPMLMGELYTILEQRNGQACDALEGRLRGKFASLFKLSRTQQYVEDQKEETRDADVFEEDDSFDIDLSEDEEETAYDSREPPKGKNDSTEAAEDEGLNESALKNLWAIEVRFTHASIRDFLVKDRGPELSALPSNDLGIGIKTQTADMHLASACIQTILDRKKDWKVAAYPAQYFIDHILSIEASSFSEEDKQPFIHLLCRLFFSGPGVRKLIEFTEYDSNKALHIWFEDTQFSTSIRRNWLTCALEDQFTREEYEWLKMAASSTKEFFRPLAVEASRMWLTKSGHNDQAYFHSREQLYRVWIVHGYLSLGDDDSQGIKGLNLGDFAEQRPPSFELASLQALANFSNFDKTQHWHTCFGWVLEGGRQYPEAMEQFNKALELDDKSWKALQGLSRCLSKQGKFDEAANYLERALQVVPDGLNPAVSALRSDLTSVMLSQRDFKAALRHARDTYLSEPENPPAMVDYVRALYAERNYDQIVNIVLDSQKNQTLYRLISRGIHQELGSALRARGRIDLARPWVDTTVSTIDRLKYPWVIAWMAEFTYSFYDDTDVSTSLFESILDTQFKSNLGPELVWAYAYPFGSAERFLSQTYFGNAIAAHNCGDDPNPWIRKLRKLATPDAEKSGGGELVYKMNDAAWLLGIYLRRYGHAEESLWKPCFRDSVFEAIDMLGDRDPMNDQSAYLRLAVILLAAGDRTNALAAAAVVSKYLEASSDPTSLKALEAIGFGACWECNGPCRTLSTNYKDPLSYKEVYICECCIGTSFCEECLPIVKKGELPFRRCSPDHIFLQIYPVVEEAKDVAARFVDMKTMEVEKDWLDALRKKWS